MSQNNFTTFFNESNLLETPQEALDKFFDIVSEYLHLDKSEFIEDISNHGLDRLKGMNNFEDIEQFLKDHQDNIWECLSWYSWKTSKKVLDIFKTIIDSYRINISDQGDLDKVVVYSGLYSLGKYLLYKSEEDRKNYE